MYLSFGVGIPCHNESQNIGHLLEELERQFDSTFYPESVVIVISASNDGSDKIVQHFINQSSLPFVLISEKMKKGKGNAVNRIIRELKEVEIIILISADVLPAPGCLHALIRPFQDLKVGVTGGRPIPEGPATNLGFKLTKLLWELHHIIALSQPKSTEITAFRNNHHSINESTLVDEAELEQTLSSQGYTIQYIPEAVIRNQSPLTLRDYLRQRIRVTRGHIILARKTNYVIGTLRFGARFNALWQMIRQQKFPLKTGILAVPIEGLIYIIAFFLSRMKSKTPGSWNVIKSTKRSFSKSKLES